MFRQSVFGRLAGYEDVNDAERLARGPIMRAIVGREGLDHAAASSSQIGRFETVWLTSGTNLETLRDMSGAWFDRFHDRRMPISLTLDMDGSESPTHGKQEGSVWNGHFGCTCYHPLFTFNQPPNAAEMRRGDKKAVLRNHEARSGSCSPAFRDSWMS